MSYVGNLNGPKKSQIVDDLGPDYFGISFKDLEEEVEAYWEEEAKGVIDPVYVDKNGRFFLIFNAPKGKTQKYYLDEHGYFLNNDIKMIKYEKKD